MTISLQLQRVSGRMIGAFLSWSLCLWFPGLFCPYQAFLKLLTWILMVRYATKQITNHLLHLPLLHAKAACWWFGWRRSIQTITMITIDITTFIFHMAAFCSFLVTQCMLEASRLVVSLDKSIVINVFISISAMEMVWMMLPSMMLKMVWTTITTHLSTSLSLALSWLFYLDWMSMADQSIELSVFAYWVISVCISFRKLGNMIIVYFYNSLFLY